MAMHGLGATARVPRYEYVLCVMLPLTMSRWELMVMRMRWVCATCIITPTFSHADAQTILNAASARMLRVSYGVV